MPIVRIVKLALGDAVVAGFTAGAARLAADQAHELAQKTAQAKQGSWQAKLTGGVAYGLDKVADGQQARYELEKQLDARGGTVIGQMRHAVIDAGLHAAGVRPAGRQATITDAHADLVLCHAQAKEAEKAGQAAQAFGLYTYAASQGYLPAKNDLAFCYMDGIGVAPDKRRAVEIFHEAATAGYTNAQFNLGHCLHHGTGIEANAVEAAHWMIQAAGGGHAGAQYFAGVYLLAGRGVSADPAEGLRLLRLSAEQAYAEAAAKLAELGGNQRYSHPAQPETPTAGVRDYPYGSAEWAWQELGLRPGASWQQVNYAHRRLMAALHPDHEGTNEEAAALNVARDVLKKLTRGS